ncbi:MAG: GAF domain-containing protein [Rhodospirillales bacterium]
MSHARISTEKQAGTSYSVPENEDFRLEVLHSHEILNTPPEAQFDRIARLASVHFRVPMSLIAMIDADRMWCKAASGVDLKEAPRGDTFCAHTINETNIMVVSDAAKDSRFKDNPFVAGEFGLRFYVGAPLITREGAVLGALCLLDTYPRQFFSPEDRQYLADLAAVTVDQMEMRRALLAETQEEPDPSD